MESPQPKQAEPKPVSFWMKFFVSYLYLIQGTFLFIPGTMILTYKEMPSYRILGYFSMATLPFAVKFISSPLIQKYSSLSYGRRKTWVVISFLLASFVLLAGSGLATAQDEETQIEFSILMTFIIFLISLEDISVDALSVKELRSVQLPSFLQCIMQPIGGIIGSLVLLMLVTDTLSNQLGLSKPIMTVTDFLNILAVITLLSAVLVHFLYKETISKSEEAGVPHSLWEVIKHYKHFIQPRYRMFRQGITVLLMFHGINYFAASYRIELVKTHNFSRQLMTTLSNISIIPIFFLTHFLSKHWTDEALIHKRSKYVLALRLVVSLVIFVCDFSSTIGVSVCLTLLTLLSNAQFFLNSMITNSFSSSMFSGMYITMMASLTNLGNNTAIQLKVIDSVGSNHACMFGFGYTLVVVIVFDRVEAWIKSGKQDEDMVSQNTIKAVKTQ